MPITPYDNGVSSYGIPVVGNGSYITTGSIFFVDSATGNNSNSGTDSEHPVATIDYAMGLCTANKNDIIFVMPNHTENIATANAIKCDVEGVSIIGLGIGNNRPELVFTAISTCDIEVDSDSVTFENIVFNTGSSTGTTQPLACIDVDDNHCSIINCHFNNTGVYPAKVLVNLDTNANDFKMLGTSVFSASDGGDAVIQIGDSASADVRGVEISNCWMVGDWDIGAIATEASALTELKITNNFIRNDAAGIQCMDLGTTDEESVGVVAYNVYDVSDSDGIALEDASRALTSNFENYAMVSAAGAQTARLSPAVQGT